MAGTGHSQYYVKFSNLDVNVCIFSSFFFFFNTSKIRGSRTWLWHLNGNFSPCWNVSTFVSYTLIAISHISLFHTSLITVPSRGYHSTSMPGVPGRCWGLRLMYQWWRGHRRSHRWWRLSRLNLPGLGVGVDVWCGWLVGVRYDHWCWLLGS